MAHFAFEQQLSEAVRMDSSISVSSTIGRQSLKPNISRLNVSGAGLNRSRSACRVGESLVAPTTTRTNCKSKSPARRAKTPTRGSVGSMSRKSSGVGDRFIPNRSTTDFEHSMHSMLATSGDGLDESLTAGEVERKRLLEENLNLNNTGDTRILSFKSKAPAAREGHANNMKVLYSSGKPSAPRAANTRTVVNTPEKILDAPDMLNDFYLHLMDWSSLNHVAVALAAGVYIWNAADGSIVQLCQREGEEEYVTSVSWIAQGNVLGVGNSDGTVQLWDVASSKLIRSMGGHTDRVGCLDWNQHLLASGGREGTILLHDVRVAEHQVGRLTGHTQEVCGLVWSKDGRTLASGGNDNCVQLWDWQARETPLHSITAHQSAVKAVSWCPWQSNVLATAGGTVDRTVRIWNTASMTQLQSFDTGSQVSSIAWNSEYKEMVTGHGFSHNQLTVWRYPSMGKVADLTGHTSRVLLLATSPDGSTIASAAADETIRLWKVWPVNKEKKEKKTGKSHPVSMLAQSIR